jgi:hypothetical protein
MSSYKDINETELINTYFKNWECVEKGQSDNEHFWAWETIEDMVFKEPIRGLEITIKILRLCKDDKALAYVAAGPLENLFVYHGRKIIDRITKEADKDPRIQLALSGVWLNENNKAYPEWKELMKRYKLLGKKPRKAL